MVHHDKRANANEIVSCDSKYGTQEGMVLRRRITRESIEWSPLRNSSIRSSDESSGRLSSSSFSRFVRAIMPVNIASPEGRFLPELTSCK